MAPNTPSDRDLCEPGGNIDKQQVVVHWRQCRERLPAAAACSSVPR